MVTGEIWKLLKISSNYWSDINQTHTDFRQMQKPFLKEKINQTLALFANQKFLSLHIFMVFRPIKNIYCKFFFSFQRSGMFNWTVFVLFPNYTISFTKDFKNAVISLKQISIIFYDTFLFIFEVIPTEVFFEKIRMKKIPII